MRGMNMRDMKARSMGRQKGSGVRGAGRGGRTSPSPPPTRHPLAPPAARPDPHPSSDFLEEEEDDFDELEPALLVDQGDGVRVAVRGYDGGGDDGFELPDEAPPGWE